MSDFETALKVLFVCGVAAAVLLTVLDLWP